MARFLNHSYPGRKALLFVVEQVLDIVDGRVTHATVFFSDDTAGLFARFGLPEDPAAR